ncbi:MAG: hypothetical protein N2167_08955 [Flavobacteriales bacterium]|nr:hypothetical protein [Flavobacteriales bacterium]
MEKRKVIDGVIWFQEEQCMWNTWIKYLLIVDFIFLSILVTTIVITDKDTSTPEKIFIPIGIALFNTLVIILFRSIKLQTVITDCGIFLRLKPFEKKFQFIAKETIKELKEVKVTCFNTGIKISKNAKSYIIEGNKAVEIYTQKMKITLGSNHYNDLNSALKKITSSDNPTSTVIYLANSEDL